MYMDHGGVDITCDGRGDPKLSPVEISVCGYVSRCAWTTLVC